ncbi:MAG: hypothetical protein QM679_09535 [Patulibacter sp.]
MQDIADGIGFGGFSTTAVSPTAGGGAIEYSDADGQGHVVVVDADGRFAAAVDLPPSADPGPVAYMPDGTAYATWSDSTTNKTYAAIVSAAGLEVPEETGLPAPDDDAGYDPGDRNLLISGSPTGQPRIYVFVNHNDHARLLSSTRQR